MSNEELVKLVEELSKRVTELENRLDELENTANYNDSLVFELASKAGLI